MYIKARRGYDLKGTSQSFANQQLIRWQFISEVLPAAPSADNNYPGDLKMYYAWLTER